MIITVIRSIKAKLKTFAHKIKNKYFLLKHSKYYPTVISAIIFIGAAIGVLSNIGGTVDILYSLWNYLNGSPLPKITSNVPLRIAVLPFAQVGDFSDYPSLGYDFAFLQNQILQNEFKDLRESAVISMPDDILQTTIKGDSSEQRLQFVQETARKVQANIILYGIVSSGEKEWFITPELYVDSDLEFFRVGELMEEGPYNLGETISVNKVEYNKKDPGKTNEELAQRFRLLTQVIRGLQKYIVCDYEEAMRILIEVEKQWATQSVMSQDENIERGTLMLYSLLGRSASGLYDWDTAELYFDKAKRKDSKLVRPYIGIGRAKFKKIVQSLNLRRKQSGKVNVLSQEILLLEEAADALYQALAIVGPNDTADNEIKARLLLGEMYTFRVYVGLDSDYYLARINYQHILNRYNPSPSNSAPPQSRLSFAQANVGLGLIADAEGDSCLATKLITNYLNTMKSEAYLNSCQLEEVNNVDNILKRIEQKCQN